MANNVVPLFKDRSLGTDLLQIVRSQGHTTVTLTRDDLVNDEVLVLALRLLADELDASRDGATRHRVTIYDGALIGPASGVSR